MRYHIHLCEAPCINNISKETYQKKIQQIKNVLGVKNYDGLISKLEIEMKLASKKELYELELEYKKQIDAISYLKEKNQVQRNKTYDEDIINFIEIEKQLYLMIFHIKKGILLDKEEYQFTKDDNFLDSFIIQYYTQKNVPKEIILPQNISKNTLLALEKHHKKTIIIKIPRQGEQKKLLDLVLLNLKAKYEKHVTELNELQKALQLHQLPQTIECFDISHISGTSTVASMVQFVNGVANKKEYRKYKLKTISQIDDYSSLIEVLTRRYTRLINEKKEFPDLIIIDGGKGQLSASLSVLKH